MKRSLSMFLVLSLLFTFLTGFVFAAPVLAETAAPENGPFYADLEKERTELLKASEESSKPMGSDVSFQLEISPELELPADVAKLVNELVFQFSYEQDPTQDPGRLLYRIGLSNPQRTEKTYTLELYNLGDVLYIDPFDLFGKPLKIDKSTLEALSQLSPAGSSAMPFGGFSDMASLNSMAFDGASAVIEGLETMLSYAQSGAVSESAEKLEVSGLKNSYAPIEETLTASTCTIPADQIDAAGLAFLKSIQDNEKFVSGLGKMPVNNYSVVSVNYDSTLPSETESSEATDSESGSMPATGTDQSAESKPQTLNDMLDVLVQKLEASEDGNTARQGLQIVTYSDAEGVTRGGQIAVLAEDGVTAHPLLAVKKLFDGTNYMLQIVDKDDTGASETSDIFSINAVYQEADGAKTGEFAVLSQNRTYLSGSFENVRYSKIWDSAWNGQLSGSYDLDLVNYTPVTRFTVDEPDETLEDGTEAETGADVQVHQVDTTQEKHMLLHCEAQPDAADPLSLTFALTFTPDAELSDQYVTVRGVSRILEAGALSMPSEAPKDTIDLNDSEQMARVTGDETLPSKVEAILDDLGLADLAGLLGVNNGVTQETTVAP